MNPHESLSFRASLAFGIGASEAYRRAAALARRPGREGAEFAQCLAAALERERELWRRQLRGRHCFEAGGGLAGPSGASLGVIAGALCYLAAFGRLMRLCTSGDLFAPPVDPTDGLPPDLDEAAAGSDLCLGSAHAAATVSRAIDEACAAALCAA